MSISKTKKKNIVFCFIIIISKHAFRELTSTRLMFKTLSNSSFDWIKDE
jgi:hypothetical protein